MPKRSSLSKRRHYHSLKQKKTDGTMMKLTYAPSGIGSGIHNRNPEEGESIDRSIDLLISRRRTHFFLFFVLVIHRAPLGPKFEFGEHSLL